MNISAIGMDQMGVAPGAQFVTIASAGCKNPGTGSTEAKGWGTQTLLNGLSQLPSYRSSLFPDRRSIHCLKEMPSASGVAEGLRQEGVFGGFVAQWGSKT